jgi:hypothetical protein
MLKALLLSVWFIFHPVHVTLTSIDYIPEKDSLKVFVMMYFDDFLLDLNMSGEIKQGEDYSAGDSIPRGIMERYLHEKLIIRVNNKLLTGKLVDLEIVDNEVKLNINYIPVKDPDLIVVKNLIMTDLYKDQSNFVIVKINDFEEGVKLTSDITEQTFKLK